MFPKLLTTSDDSLIFGEMQDKHRQPFRGVWVCHNAEFGTGSLHLHGALQKAENPSVHPKKFFWLCLWVWAAFLAVPQKFRCDLGAYASHSHICSKGSEQSFYSWAGRAPGSVLHSQKRWIRINANWAGLRLPYSALICMQTHRKTPRADVVDLARPGRVRSQPFPGWSELCGWPMTPGIWGSLLLLLLKS